jgi:hypothetical protein
MHMSCYRNAEPTRDSHQHAHKAWPAHLRKPLAVPTGNCLSVQLPTGGYELSELDDIHYALCASDEFSLILRLTEVDHLRTAGYLEIDGVWP